MDVLGSIYVVSKGAKYRRAWTVEQRRMMRNIHYSDATAWWSSRKDLEVMLGGQMDPDNIVGHMLESKENWNAVKQFVGKMLRTKEEERAVQRMAADVNI